DRHGVTAPRTAIVKQAAPRRAPTTDRARPKAPHKDLHSSSDPRLMSGTRAGADVRRRRVLQRAEPPRVGQRYRGLKGVANDMLDGETPPAYPVSKSMRVVMQ